MQDFLQSCLDGQAAAAQDWDSPEKRYLRPLLQQAALDAAVFPTGSRALPKAHPVSIPCYWRGDFRGYPPRDATPDYNCDLRFLGSDAGSPILWIDRGLDSIFCRFLDEGYRNGEGGWSGSQLNEQLVFLNNFVPMHLDGIGFSDPIVEEVYFENARRPYRTFPWNYASEPMLTAVFANGRSLAWVVLNQESRKQVMCYQRIGKRWRLREWQGLVRPLKPKFPITLFYKSPFRPHK